MRLVVANDPEAAALRGDLAGRAMDTDAAGLMTANAWLWAVELPDPDPRAVVSALLAHPELPGRQCLVPNADSAPWIRLSAEAASSTALRLLTRGESLEVPAFPDEPQLASRFMARLCGWVGSPMTGFGSMAHRPGRVSAGFGLFLVPHWSDEGLVLVGPQRAAMLWFVGTD